VRKPIPVVAMDWIRAHDLCPHGGGFGPRPTIPVGIRARDCSEIVIAARHATHGLLV
jgi:hypothetical protein